MENFHLKDKLVGIVCGFVRSDHLLVSYAQGIRGVTMHLSTVSEWLDFIATIHSQAIELGLERIREVGERLDVLRQNCRVIVVGGTNGKGSTVAGLESIYLSQGYRVGAFTSPILIKHNEYVRINGKNPHDDVFISAYAQVEKMRSQVKLTQFEFFTLGALLIFKQHQLDILLLEVGLGGRLDAVNCIDADLAVITNVELDHTDRLGDTREAIGSEKAGIMRPKKPVIYGDKQPPLSVLEQAQRINAPIFLQEIDFTYTSFSSHWCWHGPDQYYDYLPYNGLALQNMAIVLMAISLLQAHLPVTKLAMDSGLSGIQLIGRQQILSGSPLHILDVAHNPAAMAFLAQLLKDQACSGKTYGVFSMLAEKDILTCLGMMRDVIDEWYVAPLNTARGAPMELLEKNFASAKLCAYTHFYDSLSTAYRTVRDKSDDKDRIVIFGSFYVLGQLIPLIKTVTE